MWDFFFSSRRRHTRFDCDWSSDVCSSDLRPPGATPAPRGGRRGDGTMIGEYQTVIRELEGLARDRGLEFDPVVFQITDSDEIAEVASMGLPNRFIHWDWGGTHKEPVLQQSKE